MGQPEKLIENQILTYLKAKGIFCWKNQSVGVFDGKAMAFRRNRNPHHIRGVSDILGLLPNGRFLAIEVKSEKGYPTKEQKEFALKINEQYGVAFVARSIDDVKTILGSLGFEQF